ncbi:MAG: hypothetical protein KME25_01210 [Symplocastrum torsivum CPER-KK1]|jgi:MFS superfamily sulfate permease-like transporter|uniref:Uncharacterized protein n=1 Tax=Symplocastrum torsivum CPER-KK1 TaxID=450513 RepID=A0A951U7D6_9CYAN|nr:hypothetical protein [Symplocastrum torsivum CPER-KK1]
MSVFDQRGQNVNYQYNAAGNINFSDVQNRADLISELEKLKAEVTKARDAEVIDAEVATDVDYQITKAVQQSSKTEPNKNAILQHLNTAKGLITGIAEAGGIVTALMKAAELATQFF